MAARIWAPLGSSGRTRTTSQPRYDARPGPGAMILTVWPRSTRRSAVALSVVVVLSTAG